MKLLVIFPFCAKDSERALDMFRWCAELGKCDNPCLLLADPDVTWKTGVDALDTMASAFGSVEMATLDDHVEGWIPGSNALFKAAALAAKQRNLPFLFVEPDAVPVRQGWVHSIEISYENCGKPFFGPVISHQTPGLPSPYMEGVSVYPSDTIDWIGHLVTPEKSWTFSTAKTVIPYAANATPLIYHLWGQRNRPPTFGDRAVPGTNVFGLNSIKPETVLWHRCKDGTLIKQLRKKALVMPPKTDDISVNGRMRVVSLRRAGDIIALLPLLEHIHSRGKSTELVVHSDFLNLLDGVSYVKPIEWKGGWEEPLQAAKQFGAINAQVYGKGIPVPRQPANFVYEAWRKVGFQWNRYLPLTFDKRDLKREEALADKVFTTNKPKILLKLHGFSSPFPHAEFVKSAINAEFSQKAEIVCLDEVKADRLYDLIGLFDRADCLVSIDTNALHLGRGHKIPTVAFVNGSMWGSTPDCGNVIARVPYNLAQTNWPKIKNAISLAIEPEKESSGIALVYSKWEPRDEDTKRRMSEAEATWPLLGARLTPYAGGRSSAALGEKHAMPYIHDMVAYAANGGTENIIAIVNNDIKFDERLADSIYLNCQQYGCYWSHRLDKPGGTTDNGVDFVAFTRKWWALHKDLFPDFLLGHWWWDDLISRIMIWSGCRECERLYYHEPHPYATATRPNTPGMKHNERLAQEWLKRHNESHLKPIDLLR